MWEHNGRHLEKAETFVFHTVFAKKKAVVGKGKDIILK